MSGISRAVSRQIIAPLLEIDIEEDTYNIEGQQHVKSQLPPASNAHYNYQN